MNNDIKINNDALEEFLSSDVGEFIKSTKSIDNTVREMAVSSANGTFSTEGVTAALESFLEQGTSVLETMTIYCNNMPDAESVNSLASLLNALSGAIDKIASLYKAEQSHRNKIELEEKKHELKLKEHEFKERLKLKRKDDTIDAGDASTTCIPISTADIVDQITKSKK